MEPLFGSPWLWNCFIAVIEIIYIFIVIGLMDKLVAKGFSSDLSRKIIHIAAGSYLMFWPLFSITHWTKYLNVAMPFIWVLLFLNKGLSKNTADPAVKTMTRTGDPRELLRGPLMFACIMVVIGIALFNKTTGVVSMAMLTWGDGLAPYFGLKYGQKKYKTIGPEKSYVGSLTVFIAGLIGTVIMLLITGVVSTIPWTALFVSAIVVTLVEAFSPRDLDNILIPLSVIVVMLLMKGSL